MFRSENKCFFGDTNPNYMPNRIDTEKLSGMIKRKRGKMGLRKAAEIIDISAPTLSRIEQGKLPDIDTYLKICDWLGVSAEFFSISSTQDKDSTQKKVEASLRADKTLAPETVEALINMINLAYIQADTKD